MEHERLAALAGQRVDDLRIARSAQRAVTSAWVSPRVNSAEPWVRGSTPAFTMMGRTVLKSRPSMRGSPLRMRSRTMLPSRLWTCVPMS